MSYRLVEASFSTVTCHLEGIEVRSGDNYLFIITESWVAPELWESCINLLGLQGCADYDVIYDPGTRKETFIFNVTQPQPAQV